MSVSRLPSLFVVAALLRGIVPTAAHADVVEYYHLDALGSVRMVTDANGTVIETHDYLPYGEEWCQTPSPGLCGTPPAGQPRRFTGKERDTETDLDYFGARYYGSKIARFTTIDPVYTWKGNLLDPQRWNRYAYGRDNPLRYLDPDGRVGRDVTSSQVRELQRRAAAAGHGDSGFMLETALPAVGLTVTVAPLAVLAAEAAPALFTAAVVKAADPGTQATVHEMLEGLAGGPPISTFRVGHTFTKHGAAMTEQLTREAQATGRSIGQWIDEVAARKFIEEHLGELKNGARTFDLPEGIGQIIRADGSRVAATKARLVPSGGGVKTAFPTE